MMQVRYQVNYLDSKLPFMSLYENDIGKTYGLSPVFKTYIIDVSANVWLIMCLLGECGEGEPQETG